MKINNFNTDDKILIIAEIGNNHEGNFEVAKKLVEQAKDSGVDAVKFQTFRTEHYVSHKNEERFERLKSFELTFDQFRQLSDLAKDLGLLFLSTPFDLESLNFLNEIASVFKISSSDNTFYPLLERAAHLNKPIIVSTGLSTLSEVQKTVDFLEAKGLNTKENLALLHCVAAYPVSPEFANISAIQTLLDNTPCTIGYSDHTEGTIASIMAVACGARIIEKHFTLDKHYSDFRDHQLSADPAEMKELVNLIRKAEIMRGDGSEKLEKCEEGNLDAMRRSIIAARDIPSGSTIDADMITWVRPAGGLAPGMEDQILGKVTKRKILHGDHITLEDV